MKPLTIAVLSSMLAAHAAALAALAAPASADEHAVCK